MSEHPILHIKDSYFFEVPRALWSTDYDSPQAIAERVGAWAVRNDADYQAWEADLFVDRLSEMMPADSSLSHSKEAWLEWQHADPKNHKHNRPFDQYIEDAYAELNARAASWAKFQKADFSDPAVAFLAENPNPQLEWIAKLHGDADLMGRWQELRSEMDSASVLDKYMQSPRGQWSEAKLNEYNYHLSGKVFVPQPFAELRNGYETQSGFGISKYMIIEVVVAIIIFSLFRWLAGKIGSGAAPKGRFVNLLEGFLTFVKTDVVEKGIDPHESSKFMPLFWTIFMFILGCNLMGMLPWVGSPTASAAVTVVLALVVFGVGTYLGIDKFGFVGYFKNLVPDLGLPLYLAVVIVPFVWVIEVFSLFIKHAILAVRLLMNMASGHLVLLGIMGLAFSLGAESMNVISWSALSVVSILGTTLMSFLELFIAFLQAYVFTLLAAIFVGSATHHH